MNKELRSIGIIRERGQVTIPGEIRMAASWIAPDQVVVFILANDGELRVLPYSKHDTDWRRVWEGIHRARSLKGKRGNLSQFIASDRLRHS